MEHAQITETVITRLSRYMHYVTEQEEKGKKLISSSDIAQVCGVTAGLVRKDLARFGKFGVKGVGYDVTELCEGIKSIFGLDHTLRVAIIGMENLGFYFLSFKEFLNENYEIVAIFDTQPEEAISIRTNDTDRTVDVRHICRLREANEKQRVDIALIATVPSEAQEATDQAVGVGIRGILNFTSSYVKVPRGVVVKNIHFVNVQDSLVYLLQFPQ